MLGCAGVGVISGMMGAWPLFFAYPPFTVHLVLSALLGAALTPRVECLWKRPLSETAIKSIAAFLTTVIFAALPLYLFFHRSTWPAELLFN